MYRLLEARQHRFWTQLDREARRCTYRAMHHTVSQDCQALVTADK